MNDIIRTCGNCYHYPNCLEWNDDNICWMHLTKEEIEQTKLNAKIDKEFTNFWFRADQKEDD